VPFVRVPVAARTARSIFALYLLKKQLDHQRSAIAAAWLTPKVTRRIESVTFELAMVEILTVWKCMFLVAAERGGSRS
jgi:hypothetical protein